MWQKQTEICATMIAVVVSLQVDTHQFFIAGITIFETSAVKIKQLLSTVSKRNTFKHENKVAQYGCPNISGRIHSCFSNFKL